jgi:hypothetical protein
MSQAYENSIQLFRVRCKDVGLDYTCTIYGVNEEIVIDIIIMHMFEYHATKSDEMTSYIRLKITENTNVHHSPLPRSPS